MAKVSTNIAKALAQSMRHTIDKALLKTMAADMKSPMYEVHTRKSVEHIDDLYDILDISNDKPEVIAKGLTKEEFKAVHKLLSNDALIWSKEPLPNE